MASQSQLLWTLAAVAAASVVAVRWYQQPARGSVEDVGEAEHEFDALAERAQARPGRAEHERADEAERAGAERADAVAPPDGDAPRDGQDVGAAWDNDDRARRALEEHQAAQAGQEPERVNAWKQRGDVGAKKAKSLAKRDQRRAYYEYVRQEAEHRREEIQRYEEAFGDLIAKEREERQRKIEAAKAEIEEYNSYRRQLEEEDRNDRRERRERITADLKKSGIARLDPEDDGTELDIAESITGAIVLENEEYVLSVTPNLVDALAAPLASKGRLSLDDVADLLKRVY